MFKELFKRLFKDEGWHEVLFITILSSFFLFSINLVSSTSVSSFFIALIMDIIQGLTAGLFVFTITNVLEIRVEMYLSKQQKYNLTINTDINIKKIEEQKLLHNYYKENIIDILENCDIVSQSGVVQVDPHTIYGHIIHSSNYFCKSVISVDCDIDAWYYACEEDDFATAEEYFKNKGKNDYMKSIQEMKLHFVEEYKSRRRVDLTYNISNNINKRITDTDLNIGRLDAVRRLMILDQEIDSLQEKEILLLASLNRTTTKTNKRIHNKILFTVSGELGPEEISMLERLQDVIMFDEQIAYKEYLLENKNHINQKSEIITKKEDLITFKKNFEKLFNKYGVEIELFN